MNSINTVELTETLPKSGIQQLSKERDPELQDAFYIVSTPQDYIPTQVIENPLDLDPKTSSRKNPENLFFIARGATGKSAFAKFLSHQLQAPLWTTSDDWTINGHSLKLHLIDFTDKKDFKKYFSSIDNPVIIIDALDEAMVEVSPQTWFDFKEGIKRMHSDGLRFIFLGRENALFDIMSDFQDQGIDYSSFVLGNFDTDQAKEFINLKYSSKNITENQIHNRYYIEARDLLMKNIRIPGLPIVDQTSFLGYAPVLEAIATELSNSGNISLYLSELQKTSSNAMIKQIDTIIENILAREQKKFLQVLEISADDKNFYNPDEQIQCLLSVMKLSSSPTLPDELEPENIKKYTDQRNTQLENHPFLDINFKESWASNIFEAYCIIKGHSKIVDTKRMHSRASQNPVFYLLALGMLNENDLYNHWLVSALHNSFTALKQSESEASSTKTGANAIDSTIIHISEGIEEGVYVYTSTNISKKSDDDKTEFSINFHSTGDEELTLIIDPADISITASKSNVIIKPISASPVLGSSFGCYSKSFKLDAKEIRIPPSYTSKPSALVLTNKIIPPLPSVFNASQFRERTTPVLVRINDENKSEDDNWDLGYPWNNFILNFPALNILSPRIFDIISALDKLYKIYPESGISRSGFCALSHLDKKNETSAKVIKLLVSSGIISQSGGRIHFSNNQDYPLFETPGSFNKSTKFESLTNQQQTNWNSISHQLTKILGGDE